MRLHRKPPFVPFCAPQRLPVRLRVPTGHLAPAPRWPSDPPTPQLRHSPTVAVPLPLLPHPTYHRARKPPTRPSNPQPLRRHATKVPSRRALARRRLLLPRQPPPRLRLRGRRATRRPANDPTPPALVRRHPEQVHRHSRQGYFRYLERASGLDAQSPGSSSDVLEYLKYSGKFLKDSDNSRHFTPGLTRLFFRT
jgi:hypothetical protein